MFTLKKTFTMALVSTALLSMSGSVGVASSYNYDCSIPDVPSPQVCFLHW